MQSMDKCGWVKSRCFLADFQARHTFRDVQSERRRPKRLHTQVGCVTRRIRAAESPWRPWTPDAPSILGMPCDPRSVALPVCLRCPSILTFSVSHHLLDTWVCYQIQGRTYPVLFYLTSQGGWPKSFVRVKFMKLAKPEKNNSMDDVVQGQGGDWVLVKIGLG